MLVQINSDHNVAVGAGLAEQAQALVSSTLDHFSRQITRVEVHVTDENSDKKSGNDDLKCVMEARLTGHQPIAVHHNAGTFELAVEGAAVKLRRSIDSVLGRLGR